MLSESLSQCLRKIALGEGSLPGGFDMLEKVLEESSDHQVVRAIHGVSDPWLLWVGLHCPPLARWGVAIEDMLDLYLDVSAHSLAYEEWRE